MPTKDEILKKKGKFPEQLDLVSGLDSDNNKNKSRLLLILFLFLTIGTSASLWFYRLYRDGQISLNFSVPKISTPITTDKNVWEICFFDKSLPAGRQVIYQQKCNIVELPKDTVKNNIDLIKPSLPNGLLVNESITTTNIEINYLADISSPKFNYYLSIKIYGSNPLIDSQSLIPKITSDLYWQFSK